MKIAVIPARGGSKRIPRKNIRPFAGRPMLSYAVAAADGTGLFDCIAVSSEDDEILDLAAKLGARALPRPAKLADDFTPTVPVVAHAICALEPDIGKADLVCCIYPAVPFLRSLDIRDALSILPRNSTSYAFPVVRFPSAVQRALRLDDQRRVSPFFPDATDKRSQDLEEAYYDAGQFYWGSRECWLGGLGIHSNGLGLVVPEWRTIDIDTPDDWRRAELMYKVLNEERS